MLQKIKQVPVLHFTLIQAKVFVVAFFAGKQLQNTNESYHAWPWNCAWVMLTLETQLNSSVLNQNGALWLGDWDPRSPQARLTASCCSALDLWQQTKVLFLFCGAFINPQISTRPPPHPSWLKLLLFWGALNWMRSHLKRRSSTFLRVCRHLLERMLRCGDVYKMSVLGLGELIWVKKSCVAVIVDTFGAKAEFLLFYLISLNNTVVTLMKLQRTWVVDLGCHFNLYYRQLKIVNIC